MEDIVSWKTVTVMMATLKHDFKRMFAVTSNRFGTVKVKLRMCKP